LLEAEQTLGVSRKALAAETMPTRASRSPTKRPSRLAAVPPAATLSMPT
jgi:hypothetical protein